jgi:hypothetical protein
VVVGVRVVVFVVVGGIITIISIITITTINTILKYDIEEFTNDINRMAVSK